MYMIKRYNIYQLIYKVLIFSGYKDNLTNIYYGRILLTYLRHYHLENVWQEFINRPPKHQLLEEVITFIIQWFHPEKNVSCSHIDMDLDNIAQQVMKHLKVENPKHPIFSASREQFSRWKYNNIYKNQWNNSEGRQIINILFNILLYKPTFEAVIHSLKSDLFRQYLLMKDISVARRLGIYCDLVSFLNPYHNILFMEGGKDEPYYWLLKWKPKCNVTNSNDEHCFYIYLKEGKDGAILNKNNLPRINNFALECPISFDRYPRITLVELLIRLSKSYIIEMENTDYNYYYHRRNCNNFERTSEEGRWWTRFLHLVQEDLLTSLYVYMRKQEDAFKFVDELDELRATCYASRHIDLIQQRTTDMLSEYKSRYNAPSTKHIKYVLKPKQRVAEMKFAVGMIVKLKGTNTMWQDIPLVIIGWTEIDDLELRAKNQSVWYFVLYAERVFRICEVSLEKLNTPTPITNRAIGVYFCEFKGTYYMPNKMLATEYPDDVLYLINEL
ncbi:uncharacterized protein LOC105281913 isoform X3 [Ooceraea biroi]|uniref:uncharacterized protein LOC105281913 isoform X3 n=1 Tax=Ooceraea biroi TaxID=2015173 RepID=UPI000F08D0AA|nr:uncharacterized protein LOC105281913 isoform X3 [Ooceraea biroi]